MSGPEWTPEYPDAPVEGRPLSGGPGAEGSIRRPPPGPNPFGSGRAREFDRSQFDRDDAEAEANRLADEAATARPGRLFALVGAVGSVFKRRPKADRPSSESASVDLPPDSDVDDSEEDLEPNPSRRWAPSTWSRETRVGVAAVLSFLILVGVFVRGKWIKLELPTKNGEEVASKAPETPKPGDRPKGPLVAAKPTSGKPADPSKASPPAPDLAVGPGPRLHDTPTTADPNRIPEAPSPGSVVSLATDPHSTPEPTSTPDAGLPTMPPPVGTELLTQASTGDTSKPVEMPGPTSDAPPLPTNDPPGGSLPSMPANVASNPARVKPGPEAKPDEPAGSPPSGVGIDLPADVAARTPQPSESPPATEPPAQPLVVETTPPPQATQPPAEPKPEIAAAPQPANPPSGLEKVPAPAPGGSASAMGPGWVALAPGASKRPGATSSGDPGTSDGSSGVDSLATTSPSPRLSDGMSTRDDPASGDPKGDSVPHTVEPDENFWTISKKYYNSGRYYKALHKANARQVPDIAKLYVGTVIRIPPPEALDRSLIDPPALGAAIDGPSVNRVSAPKSVDADSELAPTRRARPGLRRARNEPAEEPRRPSYKVKPNDTLRSIARDTLSDSKRSLEIYDLNRDLLDDPKTPLTPGSSLTLPEDAVIGRKIR